MRKLLVLGAAIVALLSLGTVAQGQTNDHGHVWFFGDCENPYVETGSTTSNSLVFGGGCRGIGIFAGMWDNESIAEHVAYEAMEEFGGDWEVDYLKAINLFGGPPAPGFDYGCGVQNPVNVTPQGVGGGLWIAIFSVVPCEPGDEVPQGPLLAIAYIDNDTSDGGFNPNLDTTIAKLVDVDSSGNVTDGDAVVTNIYPREFDASPTGSFTVDVHILSGVSVFQQSLTVIEFLTGGTDTFSFQHWPGLFESYQESRQASPSGLTYLQDDLGQTGVDDAIQAETGSPGAPSDAVAEFFQDDPADTGFIDVEIYFIDTCATDITTAC